MRMPKLDSAFRKKASISFKTRLNRLANLDIEKKIVLLLILTYVVVMSYFTIMRMYALKASAWDLGNYNQAMYTFTFEGKLFYLTPELQNNPTGSLFGIHFSPIFFLQTPFYMVYPRPETLLVLQSFVLALGILPTYLISREYFKSGKWRMLLCLTYILNPVILGINVFDFHPEIYIPTFYLFMIYYYMKYNWKGVWFCSILIMATIEFAPTLILLFGIYFLFKDVIWSTYIAKKLKLNRSAAIHLTMMIIASIIWLIAALHIITFFSPGIPLIQGKTEFWAILGASNIAQVPISALTNPTNAISALVFDGVNKGIFLLCASITWLFLPLFSLEFWFLSSSWLLPALLSGNYAFYTIGVHYPSFFAAQLTYAGIKMVKKLGKNSMKFRLNWLTFFSFILAGAVLSNPFLSLKVATNQWAGYDLPYLSEEAKAVHRLITLVPSDASILAEQNIFPLVSSRSNAYTIPWQINFNTLSFFDYVSDKINNVDYILINTAYWKPLSAVLLSKTTDFGVLGFQDNVLLLKRAYHADPVIFEPLSYSFHYQSLNLVSGSVVSDASSPSGFVLMRPSDAKLGTDFWWGPYVYLSTPGEYSVTFWLKTDAGYIGRIMQLDYTAFPVIVIGKIHGDSTTGLYQTFELAPTSCEKRTYSGITLYGQMLNPGRYTPITMNIVVNASGIYEFRGTDVTLPVSIYLDRIDLKMTKAYPKTELVQMQTQFDDYPPVPFDTKTPKDQS